MIGLLGSWFDDALDATVLLILDVVCSRQLALHHRMLVSLLTLRIGSHALLPLALAILSELF